jgi:hypothetical protein
MTREPLTLDPTFGKLGREIARFANHTRKLLLASEKYRRKLEEACDWSEGAAPLDLTPESPGAAMRAIDKFARSRRENRATLFGAYFAHHYLRIQAQLSQDLLREAFKPDPAHRIAVAHRIYAAADETRRAWISALLDLTVAASAPDLNRNDYCAFNVGALIDHEDVDLAVVVSSVEAREALGKGFAQVSKTFLRFASKIQLFLTEQFSTPRTGALIEEYQTLLEQPGRNVVQVMQLLGAEYLCGAKHLHRALEERVINWYYAGPGRPTVHEGFLRSVMAELRYFLIPNAVPGMLAPKSEVYVPAKLATAAVRVIHGVTEPRPPHALRLLADKDPEHAETYRTLADAFVQNEMLRALMFLYVVPADEFDLSDPTIREASRRVALLLGLGASARRTPEDRLMGAYMDVRARALRCVATLAGKIERHLARVSTFRNMVESGDALHRAPGNLPKRLIKALEKHRGSVFWDEVVELIGGPWENASRFVRDLRKLDERERKDVARRYVEMMSEDAASLVEFLVFLAAQDREEEGLDNGPLFWSEMIGHLEAHAEALDSFVHRLDTDTESEALFRLASVYHASDLARLADLIENADPSTQGARVVRAIRSVIVLVHHRSNAIGRITVRVLGRAPEFLGRLGDARRLRDLGSEIRALAAREPIPREQIELLGDAFDVDVLRTALIAILEGAPAARDLEFTSAVDLYVRELFKACFRDVRHGSPMFAQYRPGSNFALYATGGYGRGEAFGGDWDYLAVVGEDDRGLKKFFGKVLQRVSGAMTRRGLLPHNRFTDHFNAYVVSIPELRNYVENRTAETFIDEAEILEARFFLGDPAVARRFQEEVRERVQKGNAHAFLRDILRELRERRDAVPLGINLKLAPGGLREIHLLWLAIRIFAELPGPLVPELMRQVSKMLPECRTDLRFLMVANAELRRARDLYRLVVAFDDTLDPDVMVETAKDLAPLRQAGVREDYSEELQKLLVTSALRIERVAEAIAKRADIVI